MATKLDARQSVLRAALPMVGSAAGDSLDTIFAKIDPELSKLFEDRNVLLTDGGIITFTGTQLQFTENLNFLLNSKVAGGVPVLISLGSANVSFTTNLDMWYAVVNRTAGTATTTVIANATGLPAVTSANQEVFLLAKRVDAGDGTQRIYWRTGMAMNAGQSVRLGASGSGSGGSGVGDDLNALQFRASFSDDFSDGPTSALSAVDAGSNKTDTTTYSAAKAMYTINYDASKTIAAATTTTNINISANAAFTVKIGDFVINNNQARRITAVATQASFTTEAFSVAPTLASQVTVSQAVYSKDIYNLALDGNALSAAFPATTFSEIMVDYEDTTTAGDNIFDIDTAPVIAYSASPDGTTFTDVKIRPTNVTDTVLGIFLPSAGSALYLRFFANKTSGSGTVNVLRYKAFMQKSLTAVSGGVINAAYGFLNGTGTEYNAVLGLSGGKTTITFPWTYAVGVSSGSPYGSLDVYINGQLIPRFIDSTVTPDASYLETSPTVITLDKDYSAQLLSFEVLQRVQIVDNSETNTSKITSLQSVIAQNLKDFVDMSTLITATTSTGSPVAGTFYSSITNRASMPDLSKDLKVRFGIDRVMVQQAPQIRSGEIGPNNEAIWAAPNDIMGRVRFAGNWSGASLGPAGYAAYTTNLNDFVEITFYGTGLNLLDQIDGNARSYAVSTDGGSETVLTVTSPSGVLNNQNYGVNIPRTMVSGLGLGIHTVKIRNNASGIGLTVYGYEVVNTASTLLVQPGSSYVRGSVLALATQQTPAHSSSFESGTLAARGGRVIVYQKSDGSIAKAVQPTNTQAAAISFAGTGYSGGTADHTNEEIAVEYNWRQFGAGRLVSADDFSGVTSAATNRAFILDDGATGLVGSQISLGSSGIADGLAHGASVSNWDITFVGTGLDLQNVRGATSDATYTITIDGTAVATNTSGSALFGSGQFNIVKLVSGLPYGAHTVRIAVGSTPGTIGLNVGRFIVYQPKTPSVPSGAIELSRYNIMATYVANATGGLLTIGTGVMRKFSQREFQYQGTWTYNTVNVGNIGGRTLTTTTNGDSARYTFFGTGFDLRWASTSTAQTFTITVDGSTNLSGFTTSAYGTGLSSFTASTGTVVSNTTAVSGNGVSVSGLSLGLHTVIMTKSAGATTMVPETFDVITPIHSHKEARFNTYSNALPVGSQGAADTRSLSLLAEPLSFQKGSVQVLGVASAPTTTSTSLVPTDLTVSTKTNTAGFLLITYSLMVQNNTSGQTTNAQVYVDGVAVGNQRWYQAYAANATGMISDTMLIPVSAGYHKIDVFWLVQSGTGTLVAQNRSLTVKEL